ncbi:hypothetical protein [Halorientalis salina]|uniref:hypothetical protein n=1 Tax=Halorientalis salina TaxID=2932266 RepID=UPI00145E84EE|nr:hypothetical protein [Halorientalis salina]
MHQSTDSAQAERHTSGPLTGRCEHCDWYVIEQSYAAMVSSYHDHLRDEHPNAWVQA